MCRANKDKLEKRNFGRNKTTQSGKNQSVWREGKLHVLGNIGSGHHWTNRDERKNEKRQSKTNTKHLWTKLSCRNIFNGKISWAVPFTRNSGLFLKWTRKEHRQMDWRTRHWQFLRDVVLVPVHCNSFLFEVNQSVDLHWKQVTGTRRNSRLVLGESVIDIAVWKWRPVTG